MGKDLLSSHPTFRLWFYKTGSFSFLEALSASCHTGSPTIVVYFIKPQVLSRAALLARWCCLAVEHTSVIPELRRPRQENLEFKDSLVCIARFSKKNRWNL
jgi:hypothetical protein